MPRDRSTTPHRAPARADYTDPAKGDHDQRPARRRGRVPADQEDCEAGQPAHRRRSTLDDIWEGR